jgi:hypothetical protein
VPARSAHSAKEIAVSARAGSDTSVQDLWRCDQLVRPAHWRLASITRRTP